jgi:lysozyme family protein
LAATLQKIVGAKPDGAIGPKTLQVVGNYETCELIEKMHSSRDAFYRSLKLFDRYGRGWTRRNDETLEAALRLAEN